MTSTTNTEVVKIFNCLRLTKNDVCDIRNCFEECKIPVIDNFVSKNILDFIEENVNIDTVSIQCTEEGYKEWKPKYKKLGDLHSFINVLANKETSILNNTTSILNKLENGINSFIQNVLGYKILNISRTYRFTKTLKENIHYDNFEPTGPNVGFLRVFVNLDNEERVWNNSCNIYDFINSNSKKIKSLLIEKGIKANYSGENRINDLIMKFILLSGFNDEMDNVFCDEFPKIQTKFAPGSIWICDSIKSSHQVVFGNKCISYNYLIDGNSFNCKDNLYYNKMNPILNSLNS
mgnify:CR=1 FL=1|tara:strand:+ start:6033 stop:6905 length:873 start_codon:yes stop_codon:yes gene_type:complete